MSESNKTATTVNFISEFTVFVVFFTLKVTGVITWSWWWVTCPLWIPAVILLAVLIIMGTVAGILLLGAWILDKIKGK